MSKPHLSLKNVGEDDAKPNWSGQAMKKKLFDDLLLSGQEVAASGRRELKLSQTFQVRTAENTLEAE